MQLFLLCLLSASLTIAAESSVLSAQASGKCPKDSVRQGWVCLDVDAGAVVKVLRLR